MNPPKPLLNPHQKNITSKKQVKVLSGGEKARLALAKFMCTRGTLLILDEPTNHLDIPSKETLEEAVRAFEGAVIAVSHDRYFLRQIATRILLVEDYKLKDFKARRRRHFLVIFLGLWGGGGPVGEGSARACAHCAPSVSPSSLSTPYPPHPVRPALTPPQPL